MKTFVQLFFNHFSLSLNRKKRCYNESHEKELQKELQIVRSYRTLPVATVETKYMILLPIYYILKYEISIIMKAMRKKLNILMVQLPIYYILEQEILTNATVSHTCQRLSIVQWLRLRVPNQGDLRLNPMGSQFSTYSICVYNLQGHKISRSQLRTLILEVLF